MKHSLTKRWLSLGHLIPSIASVAIAATVVGFTLTAHAGKITSVPSAPSVPPNALGFVADGFGGWNLDNVEIILTGTNSYFRESDGYYIFDDVDSDYTYQGHVDDGLGNVMGLVLAKDWPVGEPSGIKIVNDDLAVKEPKPTNCIMATSYLEDHFLDSTDPQQVLCSGPFQSHKRYKLAMLPTTVLGGAGSEQGIDLVFNVEAEIGSRDYQVFQKINNWTNGRLEGFTIQVGTGIGAGFVPASDGPSGVGVGNLSLSVPGDIWAEDQLANFSAGLFGPPDPHHDRGAGFYDMEIRAGFKISQYPNLSGVTDILTSDGTLGSDYAEVPAGATDQFGPWLPSSMLPQGIFWDDDGNPETDAELLAWYGWNPSLLTPGLGWMTGAAEGFAEVEASTIIGWGENLEYTQGEIDDLVNVGLNYIVTIGDVTLFPDSTFTIRITPAVDTSGAGTPDYVGVPPEPSLEFTSSDGVVAISPSPEFVVGELLTLRVGDGDLVGSVDVEVTDSIVASDCTTSGPTETVSLIEQGDGRGVFAATTDSFIGKDVGTVVTVIYTDADDGNAGLNVLKCASTVAADAPEPPAEFSDVSITDFSAPASLQTGKTAKLSVTIKNAKDAEATASGTVTISADGFAPYSEAFDLAPNKQKKVTNKWVVENEGTIEWTATVEFTAGQSEPLTDTAETVVTLKKGKNNNNGNKP